MAGAPSPPQSTPAPAPAAAREGRLAFVHGLRGIAAMAVALFHCYDSTPVSQRVVSTVSSTVDGAMQLGFLGVDLFFVISGFVISLTLYGRLSTAGEWGRFFVRRQLRLDPPYWTAIAMSIVSALMVNHLRPGTGAPVPSVGDVVAHVFYLQDFLGIKDIVGVFWTLCLEIQFYLFFGAVVLLFDRSALSGRAFGWIMLPLYLISIACFWDLLPNVPGLFLWRWFEFFTGVVLFLFWRRQIGGAQLAAYLVAPLAITLVNPASDNGIAQVTSITLVLIALLFVLAVRTGGLRSWLDRPLLIYLGNISYSLYLMHAVVGIRLLKLVVRPDASAAEAWALYVMALLLSIGASDVIFRLIERPSMKLSHHMRWRSAT
ncbi:MAG TPA: acyltransferase [Steroidobacteraceae bacterium]